MPQKPPAIGADVSSLMPQVGADASHLMETTTPRKPAATEDYLPPQTSWLDSAKNFAANFAHTVDPRPALKLLYDGAQASPLNAAGDYGAALGADLKGLAGAQLEQFRKAKQAYHEGRISEAVGHTMAGALPLVGPAAANAGEQIGSGDISGGLGSATGLLAPMAAAKVLPKAVPKTSGVVGPVVRSGLNAEEAAAVKFLQDRGIHVDAGTATGNKFVKNIQGAADSTPLGAVVESRARTANTQGLATLGEQLAAKANPGGGAVTAEQAGDAAQGAMRNVVHDWNTEATKAYEKLRTIEADPKNLKTIEPEIAPRNPEAPDYFVMKAKPKVDEVFLAALDDARSNGYKGTAAELKATFDDRLASARSLKKVTAEDASEYGDAAFLKAIREHGGLRPWDPDFVAGAPTQKMRGEFETIQQHYKGHYGQNAIFRNDGLAVDDMLDQLHADPKWKAVITPDTDLIAKLHEIATKPQGAIEGDVQHYLRATGVEPGVQWWKEGAPAQQVPMAVDLREAKTALQPVAAQLAREKELTGSLLGDKARASVALDALLRAPDHAPLSVVDAALGDLKTFIRSDNPDLRTLGQGKVVPAVEQLQTAVQTAAEAAGPEAVQALSEGRQATTAKYLAADVLQRVEGANAEPVGTFKRMTARDDSAITHLREVLTQAPDLAPHVARAVLDGILREGTEGGGFAKAGTLWNKWNDLGPQTKRLLFKDPAYISDLHNFFLGAKKMAELPNPSMSAMSASGVASGAAVFYNPLVGIPAMFGAGAVSKLLHSPAGVKLLTQGFRVPLRSPTMVASYTARLTAALRAPAALDPAMAGDTQAQTPTTTAKR